MSKRKAGQSRNRQSQSEPDDLFIARVLDLGKWAQANQQIMTVLGVLMVIAAAGVLYYGNYRRSLNDQAAQQLELVHQSIAIQDTQGAQDQLVTFLERYSGTVYEGEARLLLGDAYLQAGEPQQAQVVLSPLGSSPRDPIELQAAMLLAKAYEQDERWADAEEAYLRVADRSELSFQVEEALANAARIRGDQGDVEGAISLYQRAIDRLSDDHPMRGHYQMRITELRTGPST
jgi:predicted negative regulator of RcsB-dependent stress response